MAEIVAAILRNKTPRSLEPSARFSLAQRVSKCRLNLSNSSRIKSH